MPMWLAQQIKAAGMTYTGAMVAGWNAIQERKQWNTEIAELRANMERYRSAYLKLYNEVHSLEAK